MVVGWFLYVYVVRCEGNFDCFLLVNVFSYVFGIVLFGFAFVYIFIVFVWLILRLFFVYMQVISLLLRQIQQTGFRRISWSCFFFTKGPFREYGICIFFEGAS